MIDIYNDIFSQVLNDIKPEKKYVDGLMSEINRVVSWINIAIRSEDFVAECVKGGSIAKGTFLKGDHDVDLFVRFSVEYPSKDISNKLEHILKLVSKKLNFKFKRIHGSRDYFQFEVDNLKFEVVPVLKIFNVSEAVNITDASPLHVGFVKKQIQKHPRLADEIRLTKQFCKSAKVYGAESYINGLSGHAIDLLICFYGSFINFASSTKYWQDKVIIDVENKLKDPLKNISKSKRTGPMILVDPVDNSRNAAAALGKQKFEILKEISEKFLMNPSIEFFKMKKLDPKKIKEKYKKEWGLFFKIESVKEGSDDVRGTKILKAIDFIEKNLKKEDFKIIDSGFDFEHAYIIVSKQELDPHIIHVGPPKKQRKACKEFIEKHSGRKKIFDKDHRLCIRLKRKFMEPFSLAEKLIKDPYVNSRLKKIKLLSRVR
jgi:tRNA nucleotidyltransferase (CCA-adding enzyme)